MLLVMSFGLVSLMKVELMPAMDEGTISVAAAFRSGTKAEEVDKKMQEIEAMVAAHEDVDSYTLTSSKGSGTISVNLKEDRKMSSQEVADEWLDFIGDATLVAHNASFDMNFVNYELKQLGKPEMSWSNSIDTLEIARNMFPGARCSLDALCKRFEIDNSARSYHGALLDAQLLAEVYLELLGGKEPSLLLDNDVEKKAAVSAQERVFREPRLFAVEENLEELHQQFLEKSIKNPLWNL